MTHNRKRWASRAEQNRNKSDTRFLEFNGLRLRVSEWALRLGISYEALCSRLRTWPLEEALQGPVGKGYKRQVAK